MIRVLFATLLLVASQGLARAQTGNLPIYMTTAASAGPCDVVACAEAYSVTRAMKLSYTGPLFQLYNGSTTLDIGQVNHQVDLSTWSAFCSGVQSNCKFAKIYAQIHTTANDLIASTLHGGNSPDCTGGGLYKCASPFQLASDNSLPIIQTTAANNAQYTIASDAPATGVTGGSNPIGVVAVGYPELSGARTYCCGFFGISHAYNAATTEGTDFLAMLAFGNGTFTACGPNYCAGLDEEQVTQLGNYSTTLWANTALFTTQGPGGTTISVWLNSHQLFNAATPTAGTMNPGTSVHLGGGGDLSQMNAILREGIITNTTFSAQDQSALLSNITQFYSGLTFP